ncbi:cysteine synthase A [Marinilabiliaceae bacterium ANBcel2]|nr:cysteine synthase A [Marinilabiliaceae bacterium ANBcel2]
MKRVFKDVTELIGNTPMVKINRMADTLEGALYAKMESANPAGSVKDRPAFAMIKAAEAMGEVDKDTVIVEPTSGNMGVGLALVAAVRGYKLILTMPESMSIERRKLLKKFGAELVLTPASGGMKASIEKALEIADEHKKSFVPYQFKNVANPDIHYKTTAEEIWKDTGGDISAFVAGVGTGGTITGVGRFLKEKNPDIKIFAVEPVDSPILSGGKPGPHKIQGIGAGFIPDILDRSVIDEVIKVSNENAIEYSSKAAREEGLLVGYSSGAALYAALDVSGRTQYKGKNVVVILPDTGERYLSTF